MSNRILTINEAAHTLGCSVAWLRAAEANGKIPKARRDMNGWRRYTSKDIGILRRLLFPGRKGGATLD